MLFPSQIFLFLFLPAVLAAYYISGRRHRNTALLCFSYIFYLWGSGQFLLILICTTLADFFIARLIDNAQARHRRLWAGAALALNLGILGYFKYANFFIDQFNDAVVRLGASPVAWSEVILPIGISFFTFQKITYIVDVYRGTRKALTSFVDYALYVALFPQLIAGPIVRFNEISAQLRGRVESFDGFYQGVVRFFWGLIKKVVFANSCAQIADAVFSMGGASSGGAAAWLGVFAYTLQIYLDFSAYSDMAIGLGQMFGFTLPENFSRPYSAVSITDFWRRWHMTLSNFFRDYLYIPLGGNRLGPGRTYLNLMAVFLLCGLWHGANWTFIVWGIYHGVLLTLERMTGARYLSGGTTAVVAARRVVTLFLVMVGWVFFRADTVGEAFAFLSSMFFPSGLGIPVELSAAINNRNLLILLASSVVFFLPRDFSALRLFVTPRGAAAAAAQVCVMVALVLYSVMLIVSGSYNPFIYFQF